MRYVIDASVSARWYLSSETHENADAVLDRVLHEPDLFAVPELFFFEMLAVLVRTHPRPLPTYLETFLPVMESGVFRHPMTAGLAEFADKFIGRGLTGYDASYAALAAELGARWLTFDTRAHERIAGEGISCLLTEGLPADW